MKIGKFKYLFADSKDNGEEHIFEIIEEKGDDRTVKCLCSKILLKDCEYVPNLFGSMECVFMKDFIENKNSDSCPICLAEIKRVKSLH